MLVSIDHIVERAGAAGADFLGHVRHAHAAGQTHIALVGPQFAKQQLEQRGLAGAVAAGDTNVLAVVNGKRGMVEQQAAATPHCYRV